MSRESTVILTVEQIQRGIERLQKRIADVEAFNPKTSSNAEEKALQIAISETITDVFGYDTLDSSRYSMAYFVNRITWASRPGWDGGKQESLALLNQAIRSLQERLEYNAASSPTSDSTPTLSSERKAFVVYGHDEGARETIARFLEKIGFEAIILHEQANQGRTIIEKVEAHGDVRFAIVLLTPDDEGRVNGGVFQPRARQNVILELGYFIGRLGRKNVCALKRGDIEIPSDFSGVVYESLDASGGWRQVLGRELQAAGFEIDWNAILRS